MGYVFLMMALVALGMLGVLHKISDHRRCRPAAINLFLFLWAAVLVVVVALVWRGAGSLASTPPSVYTVALVCGFFSSLAILNFQEGVRYGEISTSWLVINLSTAIPTILSLAVYHEQVSSKRAVSLMLAIGALVLLWLDQRAQELGATADPSKVPVISRKEED